MFRARSLGRDGSSRAVGTVRGHLNSSGLLALGSSQELCAEDGNRSATPALRLFRTLELNKGASVCIKSARERLPYLPVSCVDGLFRFR